MTKLRDICRFQSGGTPSRGTPAYFNGNVPWITTVALNGDVIDGNQAIEWITDEAIAKSAAKIVPPHSVMVGTRVGIGKVAINSVPMSTSQDIISLIGIDENKWDKKFICHLITANKEHLTSQARGATIKGIKIEAIADLVLPEISLKEQARISEVIGKVDALMHMHQQMAMNLEQLIKSRFIELFGEPLSNQKGWQTMSIVEAAPIKSQRGDLADEVWLLNLDAVEAQTGTVLFKHRVQSGEINASTVYFTAESVLYSKLRPYLNKVVMPDEDGVATSEMIPMYPLADRLNRAYLCYWLRSDAFVRHISEKVAGAKMPRVSMDYFRSLAIEMPPLELQEQFAAFVEQTDKSKLAVQKGLQELEILKKSLMQQYFG